MPPYSRLSPRFSILQASPLPFSDGVHFLASWRPVPALSFRSRPLFVPFTRVCAWRRTVYRSRIEGVPAGATSPSARAYATPRRRFSRVWLEWLATSGSLPIFVRRDGPWTPRAPALGDGRVDGSARAASSYALRGHRWATVTTAGARVLSIVLPLPALIPSPRLLSFSHALRGSSIRVRPPSLHAPRLPTARTSLLPPFRLPPASLSPCPSFPHTLCVQLPGAFGPRALLHLAAPPSFSHPHYLPPPPSGMGAFPPPSILVDALPAPPRPLTLRTDVPSQQWPTSLSGTLAAFPSSFLAPSLAFYCAPSGIYSAQRKHLLLA
ncbi:hypothetical protein FB451DRAFT_1553516 [Mycena latifolia]|nr:hypothetical protein FB451DRAFT_1553516 [Mycena latifolia]